MFGSFDILNTLNVKLPLAALGDRNCTWAKQAEAKLTPDVNNLIGLIGFLIFVLALIGVVVYFLPFEGAKKWGGGTMGGAGLFLLYVLFGKDILIALFGTSSCV